MKIIESSIIGKKSQEACEDGMVITDDFIAVIDGSTSKTPKHLNPDMKNGRYAMMLISEYIREELKAEASVDDFCQGVTAYIYNKVYEKLGVEERLKEHPEERLHCRRSPLRRFGQTERHRNRCGLLLLKNRRRPGILPRASACSRGLSGRPDLHQQRPSRNALLG